MTVLESPITDFERNVINAILAGQSWNSLPLKSSIIENTDTENTLFDSTYAQYSQKEIRAEIILHLINNPSGLAEWSGATSPNPESLGGIKISGVRIKGTLNLEAARFIKPLLLTHCLFDEGIVLSHAELGFVDLSGSHIPFIRADSLVTHGHFHALDLQKTAFVDLISARIRGRLNLSGSTLNVEGSELPENHGRVLSCNGMQTTGGVFLNNVLFAKGTVYFYHADIAGTLQIHSGTRIEGTLDLRQASTLALWDNLDCWPDSHHDIRLDGFTYERIAEDAPIDWKTRYEWLNRQPEEDLKAAFKPQPWTQLAKVLRIMGHEVDSKIILQKREKRRPTTGILGWRQLKLIIKILFSVTSGYGYRPWLSLYWSVAIILIGAAVYDAATRLEMMRPRDTMVITRGPYLNPETQVKDQPIPEDYERIKPWLFSVDLFVPIIDLSQDRYWLPRDADERVVTPEQVGEAYLSLPIWLHAPIAVIFDSWFPKAWYWIQISLGWILSTIAIAGFSGALKRD